MLARRFLPVQINGAHVSLSLQNLFLQTAQHELDAPIFSEWQILRHHHGLGTSDFDNLAAVVAVEIHSYIGFINSILVKVGHACKPHRS
jgi:hypothetical protein